MTELKPLFGNGVADMHPMIIAGPCSAETEEQVLAAAHELAKNGVKIFRAGIWKPRTKPGGFEGVGTQGLQWLKRVKEETGMMTSTEVATRQHVNEALEAGVDLLWIGARALQRLYNAGIMRLGAIHRGFSSYGKHLYRNLPQWHIPIELRRRYPNLPLICDPSHIGGKRELVAPLSQQALDMGFDGLIIESHCDPDCAWSDKAQQVTPEVLNFILNTLVLRDSVVSTESLNLLRQQIDELDNELLEVLNKRMRVSREIGQYKKEHRMPVLQIGRHDEIMQSRAALAEEMGMSGDFMRTVLSAIHEESVRQQIEVLNDRTR